MKKSHENNEVTPDWMRWLDGEMPATERSAFEELLQKDPDAQAELDAAQHLSQLIKQELPASLTMPHADFFNSQIQVRLAQEDAADQRTSARAAKANWLAWLKTPWLVGAAAAAVVAIVFLKQPQPITSSADTLVMSTYAPNPNVVVTAFHSDEADATVLVLEGLDELPADRKVVGWNLGNGELDPAFATTTFRGASGQVEVVMTRDAQNQPRLWSPRS